MPAMPETPVQILLAEDEEMIRHSLLMGLRRAGFQVQGYANGLLAFEAFQECSASLVITDIQMPLLDGVELVRRIRGLAPEIPVLVMTGYDERERQQAFQKLGGCQFISKPFRMENFLSSIRESLNTTIMAQHSMVP